MVSSARFPADGDPALHADRRRRTRPGPVLAGGTAAVLWWQLVARSPSGMLTIALLVWGESHLDSYALAGSIVAGYSVGFAFGAPISARLLRVFGTPRMLVSTAVISGGALVVITVVNPPLPAAIGLASLAGLSFPPVTPLARSIYSRIAPAAQLERVYALDAVAQEFIWVLGPLAATLLAAACGPSMAIAVCAGVLVLGAVVFASLREARAFVLVPAAADTVAVGASQAGPRSPGRSTTAADATSGRIPRPALLVFAVIVTVGFFLVGSGAIVEVLIVSRFGYHDIATGFLLGVIASGSLVGGLTIGRCRVRAHTLALRLLLVVVGMVAAAPLVGVPVWLAVPLFVSGLGIAPAFAAMHAIIARTIPVQQRTEAYAVSHSGQLVGMAMGTAVAGVLVEQIPGPVVLLIAAGSAFAAAVLAAMPLIVRR